MYRLGHQGVNLVLFAPVLLVLIVAGYPLAGLAGVAVVFTTASLPDVDHRLPLIEHRGVTHTVWAALVVGAAAAVLAWLATGAFTEAVAALGLSRPVVAVYAGGLLSFSVLGHLAGDVLTPMGIAPLYPLSTESYTLSVCPAKSWLANRLLFAGGVGATAAVVGAVSVL
jgi:inner membrane protein